MSRTDPGSTSNADSVLGKRGASRRPAQRRGTPASLRESGSADRRSVLDRRVGSAQATPGPNRIRAGIERTGAYVARRCSSRTGGRGTPPSGRGCANEIASPAAPHACPHSVQHTMSTVRCVGEPRGRRWKDVRIPQRTNIAGGGQAAVPVQAFASGKARVEIASKFEPSQSVLARHGADVRKSEQECEEIVSRRHCERILKPRARVHFDDKVFAAVV